MEGKQRVLWYFIEKKGQITPKRKIRAPFTLYGKSIGNFFGQTVNG